MTHSPKDMSALGERLAELLDAAMEALRKLGESGSCIERMEAQVASSRAHSELAGAAVIALPSLLTEITALQAKMEKAEKEIVRLRNIMNEDGLIDHELEVLAGKSVSVLEASANKEPRQFDPAAHWLAEKPGEL